MTFNTTSLPLWAALRAKRVIERLPLRPLGEQKRFLLVAPQVDALLDGHINYGLFPSVSADKLIAVYEAGQLLLVSRKKTKRKPDLEQIEGHDQVWALCARTPQPGWRLLGRFYDKDTLVALRAWDKRWLFSHYDEAATTVIADWHELFGPQQRPHAGTNVSDYVSGVFRDVDETE